MTRTRQFLVPSVLTAALAVMWVVAFRSWRSR